MRKIIVLLAHSNEFEVSTGRCRPKTQSHAPTKNNHFAHLLNTKITIFHRKISEKIPCEQQVLIELAINSGDFW
jgi:hypothetical protein